MNFTLTIHTQERLQERKLPFYLLQLVIEAPEQVVEEKGVKIYQSRFEYNGKTQLLRAVVDDSVCPVVVVTIYVTSKIKKYWRQ